MSDEREHITLFELARWSLPTLAVLLGVVFYLIYAEAAPAVGAAILIP
jgi:hypothetical protein